MRVRVACLALGWAWLFSHAACAQGFAGQPGALQLLQKVAVATQNLNYSGTFVYRHDSQSETSRVVHVASNGNQIERLEVLDGSPREVIRRNDEVECYLPDEGLVIVEQRSTRRTFPALLPASLANLTEHYHIRNHGEARIAGFDSRIIRLDPRDAWRYGHQYWVDPVTGLLLKADVLDESGQTLESMAFIELRVGESGKPVDMKAGMGARKEPWKVRQARLSEMKDDNNWLFRHDLPGFRRQAAMRRSVDLENAPAQEALHWVYSDGLAAFSVFISPQKQSSGKVADSMSALGATNVMKRVVAGHEVVVMGDLPAVAIRRFADGIGRAK